MGNGLGSGLSVLALVSLNCFASAAVITGNAVGDLVVGKAPPVFEVGRLVFRNWEIDENGQPYELLKVNVDNNEVSAEVYEGLVWRISVDEGTLKTRDGIKVGDRASELIRKNLAFKPELGPGPTLVLVPTRSCGISYVTDARLPDEVALPLTSAAAARITRTAKIKTILVVGCEK